MYDQSTVAHRTLRNFIFSMTFILAVGLIVASVSYLSSSLELAQYQLVASGKSSAPNLESAKWTISEVTNSQGKLKIELRSNVGNIKTLEGINSYALDNGGDRIVVSTPAGINVIKLSDETSQALSVPFTYAGDFGKAFSWSSDNKYVAVIVAKDRKLDDAHLVAFNAETGEVVKDISGNFAARAGAYLPVKFSPRGNLMLARTCASVAGNCELDTALVSVFNLQGERLAHTQVRGPVTTADNVVYFWGDESQVYYGAFPTNQEINFTNYSQFKELTF